MTDFLNTLMHPLPNAVMTVIMGVLALYWIFVFISGTGFDGVDLGIDIDADIDVDVDTGFDLDTDINADGDVDSDGDIQTKEPSAFMKFLNFLNVGKVPFMLILSTFKFFLWIGSLITTSFISVVTWGTWSLLILIPLAIVGIFLTRLATIPMVKVFKEIGYSGDEAIDFLGRTGKMLSDVKGDSIGSAEVMINEDPIRLNVKSADGQELKYGDYVIVTDETDDKRVYLVIKEISVRQF